MNNNNDRKGRTKDVKGVFFPTPAAQFEMPDWYGEMLVSIKELVANGRRQVMFTANVQMSMMYYRIGQIILQRQNNEGWGEVNPLFFIKPLRFREKCLNLQS